MAHPTASQKTLPLPLSPRSTAKRPSPGRDLDHHHPSSRTKPVALSNPAALAPSSAASQEAMDKRNAATSANAGGGAGCRLLWRGRLTSPQGRPLHGVAMIAHLFTVSSAASSLHSPLAATSSSLSPFDDPFSSASSATASGADMCLGLEMLRGAPIAVKDSVRVRRQGGDSPDKPASTSSSSSAGKKGKARAREESEVECVEVETPTDVRVYVDGRCPETVEWFEDTFCRQGREGYGVKLDAGGEEVILFASLPVRSDEQENLDPSASTSSAPPPPPLTLLLGRRTRVTARKPRPDDPLPRESLFANKLRKTASLPASAFTLSSTEPAALPPPAKKAKRQSAKDKVIASLLSKNGDMAPPPSRARATSSQPPGIAFPPPPAASSRPFARSASSRFPSAGSTSSASLARQASLPPLASLSTAGRRASVSGAAGPGPASGSGSRPFQRTLSRSSMLLDSPPGSDDDEELPSLAGQGQGQPQRSSRGGSRAPSPTPSLASALGNDANDEDGGEGLDGLADLRSFGGGGAAARSARGGKGPLARSSSLPVGQFALGAGAAVGGGVEKEKDKGRRREREGTALPSVREGSAALEGAREGTVEARNKNTVKKLVLARMTALGCGKEHAEFRDVFSFTTRGVAFAMRATFKSSVLSPSDRELASFLTEQHLRLYLPSPSFPTPSPTPDLALSVVKQEPTQHDVAPHGIASPKSLGDGLEEAGAGTAAAAAGAAAAAREADEDAEMAEAQLHEEEDEQHTQLPEEGGALSAKGAARALDRDEEDHDVDEVVLLSVPGGGGVKMGPAEA